MSIYELCLFGEPVVQFNRVQRLSLGWLILHRLLTRRKPIVHFNRVQRLSLGWLILHRLLTRRKPISKHIYFYLYQFFSNNLVFA